MREAVRLVKAATLAAATDPRTGRIDMNIINTGFTESARELRIRIETALERVTAEDGHTTRLDILRQRVLNKLSEYDGTSDAPVINPDDRATASVIDQICRDSIARAR